ncbi:MAG: hypothetical protein JXC32_13505 [Anaerolineae bacterium]|nr:hypothetical protein [Anaerolineae bacterium]
MGPSSLRWAVELARTARWPDLPYHIGGLAAYDAWADALEVDVDYMMDDPEVRFTRVMVHDDQCTMVEERHNAAHYLQQVAATRADEPEAAR